LRDMDLENNLMTTISMVKAEIEKQEKENRVCELELILSEIMVNEKLVKELSLDDLRDLRGLVDDKLKEIRQVHGVVEDNNSGEASGEKN
ncbi:unnamed protein product, partial [Ilex paraguariensis]